MNIVLDFREKIRNQSIYFNIGNVFISAKIGTLNIQKSLPNSSRLFQKIL